MAREGRDATLERVSTPSPRPFYRPRPKDDLFCDAVSLRRLARRWGTPLYVYSAEAILARYAMFADAFAGQPHLLCYSVKANPALAILKLLAAHGAGFDIVSGGELERVLRVDRAAAVRVVFSGVGKTAPELDLALRARIRIFNVESEGELELLAERAARRGVRARFALRVNPDVFAATHPYISTGLSEHKFGVSIDEARRLYARVRSEKRLNRRLQTAGISVHIGSQIRESGPFGAAAARVVSLVRELRAAGDVGLQSIDLGGGLGIEYEAEAEWNPESRVADYAAALRGALAGLGPVELLLEPGRFLVAQAGALLTEVVYTKRNGAKRFVVVDAGMNDLLRPSLYGAHHAMEPVGAPKPGAVSENVDVVGPVCESGDFLARDRALPPLRRGDLLAVLDAGAYGQSLASNYNTRPRPAEVLVEGKRSRLIRRRETVRELFRMEKP